MTTLAARTAAQPATATATAPASLLQRACACGKSAGPSGSCGTCDSEKRFGASSLTGEGVLQRDPTKKKLPPPVLEPEYPLEPLVQDNTPKTNEEEYKEAGGKLVSAITETAPVKAVIDTVVDKATGTTPAKIASGSVIAGSLAGLYLTGKELPFQMPFLPLPKIGGLDGLSAKVIVNGPLNNPTEVVFVLRLELPGEKRKKKRTEEKGDFVPSKTPYAANDQTLSDNAIAYAVAQESARFAKFAQGAEGPSPAQAADGLTLGTLGLFEGGLPPGLIYDPIAPLLLGEGLKLELPITALPKMQEAPLQKKLSIGSTSDPLEAEADRVADQVLARPAATGTAPPQIQRLSKQGSGGSGNVPESVHRTLGSSGAALDANVRQDMEARFGQDFGNVRVHTDARSASDVDALAYTVGSSIVFGAGQYAPGSGEGRRLLAHELTHVVQQGSGAARTTVQRDGMGDVRRAEGKQCLKSFTIADDIYTAIDDAWNRSNHGGDTVTEQGGRVVTDKAGKQQIRTGSGGSGSISLPVEQAGDRTTATFHTHPYSKSEGSHVGVAFSAGDIENFLAGNQGSVKYVGAGSCYFILDTVDSEARDKCKTEKIKERWSDAFSKASGTMARKVELSVSAAILGCGLCFYKACQPDAKSKAPKLGKLV